MEIQWKPNQLTVNELADKGELKPGMALRFPGGRVELIGSMNDMGGTCDDCPHEMVDQVPSHTAQLVRLDEVDSRFALDEDDETRQPSPLPADSTPGPGGVEDLADWPY